MYSSSPEIKDGVVLGTGIAVLPHTGESTVGAVVAYMAITIGGMALLSHIAVRAVRRANR